MAQHVNDFLIGADPEFALFDPPHLVNASRLEGRVQNLAREAPLLYGFDHGGYVLEPHPRPDFLARNVLKDTRVSLNQMARVFGDTYKWRAGAYYQAPERAVSFGGHVHIDQPQPTTSQLRAFGRIAASFEHLDILPHDESTTRRRETQYGQIDDHRIEHGHYEYRGMCSWLFSRKTAMLCLTAIKLAAVQPSLITRNFHSLDEVRTWMEGFKGHDDDVDWILDKGYFDSDLTAKPDHDIKSVWHVDPADMAGVDVLPQDAVQTEHTNLTFRQIWHVDPADMANPTFRQMVLRLMRRGFTQRHAEAVVAARVRDAARLHEAQQQQPAVEAA